jgi:hypothetical protein
MDTPAVGIDHLTVVPANFDGEDDGETGADTQTETA